MKYQSNQKPTAVFFSNPFGYGPTGTAIALMETLFEKWPGQIIYAASRFCLEPFQKINDHKLKVFELDERNFKTVTDFLRSIPNPYVVSSLNRFSLKAAHFLNIPSAFIDILTWFWQKIPDDYLLADYYFCPNLPGTEEKIKDLPQLSKIILVPAVLGTLPSIKCKRKKKFILVHIGGCLNPLYQGLPIAYLRLLTEVLNKQKLNQKIFITGGHMALQFIEKRLKKKNVFCCSFSRKEFLEKLGQTNLFITTAGQAATLEAFALNTPTSFLPPTNLSQWALANLLTKYKAAPNRVMLEEFITPRVNLQNLSEKEGLILFSKYYQKIADDKNLRNKYTEMVFYLLDKIPENKEQQLFINKIGVNGAEVIVNELQKRWSF